MKMISVIIPVYNAERYLERCLESVKSQTYGKLEIILIDDGSTDASGLLCDEAVKRDERIRVRHQENRGVSAARNEGLSLSQGEYITFVDADDIVDRCLIEHLYHGLCESGADICICDYKTFLNEPVCDNKKNAALTGAAVYSPYEAIKAILEGDISNVGPCTKLFTKSLADRVRFSERIAICEDALYVLELFSSAEKIAYIPLALYYYRQSVSSSTTSVNFTNKAPSIRIAYEEMKKILEAKAPQLLQILEKKRIRLSLHVLDVLIKLEIPCSNETYRMFYQDIQKNKWNLLWDGRLSIKTRAGLLILLINENLYREIKCILYKKEKEELENEEQIHG